MPFGHEIPLVLTCSKDPPHLWTILHELEQVR